MQSNATGVLLSSQNNLYHINQSAISLEDQQAAPDPRDEYSLNSYRLRGEGQSHQNMVADGYLGRRTYENQLMNMSSPSP